MDIRTGLMAELKNGDVVRIVAVIGNGIKAEGDQGIVYAGMSIINRTYEPREALGSGGNFTSRATVDDSGIELPK